MRLVVLAISIAITIPGVANGADGAAAPLRLPFHIKQGLILIKGRVDSTPGVFLLDTGVTEFHFLLNRNYVPLEAGADLYKMHAASGQSSMIRSHLGHHNVELAGRYATSAQSGSEPYPERVLSDDFARMQENIVPNLLGAVGFGFLKHYDFTLDYQRQVVSLYPLGSVNTSGMGITVTFTPKSPVVPFALDVGQIRVPAYLDTGGWERLKAPPEIWAALTSSGHILSGRRGEAGCVSILRAQYGSHVFDIPHTEKVTAQKTILTLGYPFLRHYLSVWKPLQGTVTLERKRIVRSLPPFSCT